MSQHLKFLNTFIQRIGKGKSNKKPSSPESLISLCHQLVSNNSEATLFSLAKIILDDFVTFTDEQKNNSFP